MLIRENPSNPCPIKIVKLIDLALNTKIKKFNRQCQQVLQNSLHGLTNWLYCFNMPHTIKYVHIESGGGIRAL